MIRDVDGQVKVAIGVTGDRHRPIHNVVISNVPGPPFPLYYAGAQLEYTLPMGPVMEGAGLNITVMSSNGQMHVGLIACREAMPDIATLAGHFPTELDALYAATVGG